MKNYRDLQMFINSYYSNSCYLDVSSKSDMYFLIFVVIVWPVCKRKFEFDSLWSLKALKINKKILIKK